MIPSAGCFQTRIESAAVLEFHRAAGVPDRVRLACETAAGDGFAARFGLKQPYLSHPPDSEADLRLRAVLAERGSGEWTFEMLKRAAEILDVDIVVAANVRAYSFGPAAKYEIPRPRIDIEFLYLVPDGLRGAYSTARPLEASDDDLRASPEERMRRSAESAARAFLSRLEKEFAPAND